jgi:hypothetical protein
MQSGDVEKLEARLEVHRRELESKGKELSMLTSTVLQLREQLASSLHVGGDDPGLLRFTLNYLC